MDTTYIDSSLYPAITDHDAVFNNLRLKPVIINHFDPRLEEDRKQIRELTTCHYNSDQISVTPKCSCGHIRGGYAADLNRLCPLCGTRPEKLTESKIQSNVWMEVPPGVLGFIEPNIWTVFFDKFRYNKGGFNPWEWLAGMSYATNQDALINSAALIEDLKAMGLDRNRGINSLITNCDMLVNYLLDDSMVKKLRQNSREHLYEFYQENRHLFFPKHLPVPNRILFIVEDNATGRYADYDQKAAKDAVLTITSQHQTDDPRTLTSKQLAHNEKITYRASRYFQEFYLAYEKEKLWPKSAIIRQNVVGTRVAFSGRGVITSLTRPHRHTDIILPWSIVIPMLQPHFLNRLYRRGYSPIDALSLINSHIHKWHPVLDEIISEFEQKGIRITIGRNPTLQWLSIRAFICKHVNRNPDEKSIQLSILTVKPFNADFDGDEMSIMFHPDNIIWADIQGLASHQCVLDMNKPFTIGGNTNLPTVAIANLNRWKMSND